MSPSITQLGKYEIRRELGKGAMGVVYEGYDPVLQRRVAIKTILPSQLVKGEAADIMARFKREAQAAGRLNHPGVVAVYDYGEAIASSDQTRIVQPGGDGLAGQLVAFIAMEFVQGQELKDHFEANECFTPTESARIMGEILDALAHSHGQGVIHRDIKPANLIMLADGRVKIADFGIARTETSELTQAGTVLGTPAYMSPEQFLGQRVDARSDLFACGIILYQFLTGEKPFTGNPTTIMYKVLREEPLPPCTLNMMLPPIWNEVLKTAMAKHPDDRFQSAVEFGAAIREALAHHGSGPLVPPSQSAVLSSQAAPLGRAQPERRSNATSPQHSARKFPVLNRNLRIGAVVVGLLLLFAVLAYQALGRGGAAAGRSRVEPPELAPAKPVSLDKTTQVPPEPVTPQRPAIADAPEVVPVPQTEPVVVPTPALAPAKVLITKPPATTDTKPRPTLQKAPVQGNTRPARCALILQKATLGEPITPEERKFLNESCQ
jgi:serine/threonine protein kinase